MVFATNNENKVHELQEIFKGYNIKSLKDYDINVDIVENGKTFYENALIKAKAIYDMVKVPVIADDSGLIFLELNDYPGIYTNRIIEDAKKSGLTRNEFLIKKGKELRDKRIKAVCTLVYFDGKKIISATGELHGTITEKEYPGNGFGFDSIFKLDDGRILSQLTSQEKNKLSHRHNASVKLKNKLKNILEN